MILALSLAFLHGSVGWLDNARAKAIDKAYLLYDVVSIPERLSHWAEDRLVSRQVLLGRIESLDTELLIHKRKMQQMASLVAENTRLRQLLNSADTLDDKVLVAELIGVSPDPGSHRIFINRGLDDGVYIGQPVVDANGLVGQIIEVGEQTSIVLLISDTSHALPVLINRNGVRLVAQGQGNLFRLALRHVSSTVDVKEGDLLVSSGLGQRFPAGYPVATIEKIIHDPGKPFVEVIAKPKASLNRNRHLLLVFESQFAADQFSEPEITAELQ